MTFLQVVLAAAIASDTVWATMPARLAATDSDPCFFTSAAPLHDLEELALIGWPRGGSAIPETLVRLDVRGLEGVRIPIPWDSRGLTWAIAAIVRRPNWTWTCARTIDWNLPVVGVGADSAAAPSSGPVHVYDVAGRRVLELEGGAAAAIAAGGLRQRRELLARAQLPSGVYFLMRGSWRLGRVALVR